jgi:predicted regulator of Ras-like GTPase activity (Roadblock/LC7/MglB family)
VFYNTYLGIEKEYKLCYKTYFESRVALALTDLVIYPEEFTEIRSILSHLAEGARAKIVFLVDRNGQPIASHGDDAAVDTASLSLLAAGSVAATEGLARLLGEREFSVLFREGERDNVHFSVVAHSAILVVIFDHRTPLGLVRLRVRKATAQFEDVFEKIKSRFEADIRSASLPSMVSFPEITDDDIDRLFSD